MSGYTPTESWLFLLLAVALAAAFTTALRRSGPDRCAICDHDDEDYLTGGNP